MWLVLTALVITGVVACAVLAAFERWIAFWMFLTVYVIGVVAATVQAVLTT